VSDFLSEQTADLAPCAAVSRTAGRALIAARTRAIRTDRHAAAWNRAGMSTHRKRRALDLFLDALTHPVRFR